MKKLIIGLFTAIFIIGLGMNMAYSSDTKPAEKTVEIRDNAVAAIDPAALDVFCVAVGNLFDGKDQLFWGTVMDQLMKLDYIRFVMGAKVVVLKEIRQSEHWYDSSKRAKEVGYVQILHPSFGRPIWVIKADLSGLEG